MKQSNLVSAQQSSSAFWPSLPASGPSRCGTWPIRTRMLCGLPRSSTPRTCSGRLSTDQGIDEAIDWCKKTGVTHAFIESFRDGYTAERKALEHARDRFRAAGFDVSGCVTPTKVGKDSTGWTSIACYTDEPTQKHVQEIFEYTASMFDEIMIDDFWFTDCQCDECQKARGDKSWAQYRCDLMTKVSRDRVLQARQGRQSQRQDHHQIPPVVRSVPQSRLRGRAGDGRLRPDLGGHGDPRLRRQAVGRERPI